MVQVQMNNGKAVVQNQAEIAGVRAQALNPTETVELTQEEAPQVVPAHAYEAPSDLPRG